MYVGSLLAPLCTGMARLSVAQRRLHLREAITRVCGVLQGAVELVPVGIDVEDLLDGDKLYVYIYIYMKIHNSPFKGMGVMDI